MSLWFEEEKLFLMPAQKKSTVEQKLSDVDLDGDNNFLTNK